MAGVIREKVVKQTEQSQFISLLLGTPTDKSTKEELVVYVRYFKNGQPEECFLELLELENSYSEFCFLATEKLITSNDLNLKECLSIMGITTDGVANMVGEISGICDTLM